MAELATDFNAADVPEDERNFDILPAGDYQCQIIASDVKPTKDHASTGNEFLELTIEVIAGPAERRKLWDRINIKNANADAQRIAQRTLADLCLAVGVSTLRNTEDLHFKPFLGKVRIVKPKAGSQYTDDQNGIRYRPLGNQPPVNKPAVVVNNGNASGGAVGSGGAASQQQTQSQPTQQRAAAGGSRPWKR